MLDKWETTPSKHGITFGLILELVNFPGNSMSKLPLIDRDKSTVELWNQFTMIFIQRNDTLIEEIVMNKQQWQE